MHDAFQEHDFHIPPYPGDDEDFFGLYDDAGRDTEPSLAVIAYPDEADDQDLYAEMCDQFGLSAPEAETDEEEAERTEEPLDAPGPVAVPKEPEPIPEEPGPVAAEEALETVCAPEAAVASPMITVPLDRIETAEPAHPNVAMIEGFKAGWEQLDPVLLQERGDGAPLRIIAGTRRVHAMRQAGRKEILARILPAGLSDKQVAVYALSSNAQRAPNEQQEYDRIIALAHPDNDTPGISQKEIERVTGIPFGTIKRRLALRSLPDELMTAWRSGCLTTTHATRIAWMDETERRRLAGLFVQRLSEDPQTARITKDDFATEDKAPPAWQAEARSCLKKLSGAIPKDSVRLRELLEQFESALTEAVGNPS